jgi:hypothetical protein
VSHSFFAGFWALCLAFFLVRDIVEHTAVTSEIPAARAETCLVGHFGSCVLIVSGLLFLHFGLINIRSVIEKFLIVLKEFFDRAASFERLASFRQISLQLLFPLEFYAIIRIFCILKVLGPFMLKSRQRIGADVGWRGDNITVLVSIFFCFVFSLD